MLILIGIAVCAILLTSPVLASAGYSKIYGNANEDDVLDMRDVTYIKLVIFGKKPATTFVDANYDGKISMLDIGQTKLIILGKEKKLTLVDQADRTVTINKPVERVITPELDVVRTFIHLGAADKLVGLPGFREGGFYLSALAHPELTELPAVGGREINTELIVSLEPDVIFGLSQHTYLEEKTGILVICFYLEADHIEFELYRLIGTIMGKEKEAEELISYANGKLAKVTEVTSQIPDSKKPRVYMEVYRSLTPIHYDPIALAGGIDVAEDLADTYPSVYAVEVSKEQIVAWNPDIIVLQSGQVEKIEEILSDSALQTVNAVKNRRIYGTIGHSSGWDPVRAITETFYMAKLFHPEEFKDLDVEKEGNEILRRAYGVDDLYTMTAENRNLYRWE